MDNIPCYLVVLSDFAKESSVRTICHGDEELANLLLHLDKDCYMIEDIVILGRDINSSYKDLLKEDKNLEKG